MPMLAGTVSDWPSTNTSRCEWMWYCSCSDGSASRPARRISAVTLVAGADHGAGVVRPGAPGGSVVVGWPALVGTAGPAGCAASPVPIKPSVVDVDDADFDPPPHAAK